MTATLEDSERTHERVDRDRLFHVLDDLRHSTPIAHAVELDDLHER